MFLHVKKLFVLLLVCVGGLSYFSLSSQNVGTPKSVFFLVHTEPMGGKGVYEIYREMKALGHKVKIVAIPYFYSGKLAADIDLDFMKKFDDGDVLYPCGKQAPYTKKCESIEHHKPDYIFTQNPYNAFKDSVLDPVFVDDSLKKTAKKVMYIPYGPHIFHQGWISDPNLSKQVHTVFVDSKSTQGIYRDGYKFAKSRAVVSGYQTYKTVRDMMGKERNKKFKETILWLPRWSLSFRGRHMHESGSTFLVYYHFFYNYAVQNPDVQLIIRPHVSLFPRAIENQHLSQDDVNEIIGKFTRLDNVVYSQHISKSLVEDIMESDIVIADGTSALAEVVVADKPIIYLSNGLNLEFDSVPLSQEFKKYLYMAYDPRDIIAFLDEIRKNQYAPFQETLCTTGWACKIQKLKNKMLGVTSSRSDFKKMLDPVENPAKFIAEYIWHDTL